MALLKLPLSHGSGADAPTGQMEPGSHGTQKVALADDWYVPPSHGEHWSAPSAEIVPALQLVGVTLPVEQNAPAGQRSQSVPAALLLVVLA